MQIFKTNQYTLARSRRSVRTLPESAGQKVETSSPQNDYRIVPWLPICSRVFVSFRKPLTCAQHVTPGFDPMAAKAADDARIFVVVLDRVRARPDQPHRSVDHVEELRQLVDA